MNHSTPPAWRTPPQRRTFLARATGGTLALVAWFAAAPTARALPRYTVPLETIQDAVAQKFPRNVPVQGLLDFTLQAPRLRLLPEVNRLAAVLPVTAAGPALRRSHEGSVELEFALRYEASDRTLRAHQIRLGALEFPSLRPEVAGLLKAYGPALAEQALGEVTLHQLRPQDTAMLDGLGMQPGAITVTAQGLVVAFESKPR